MLQKPKKGDPPLEYMAVGPAILFWVTNKLETVRKSRRYESTLDKMGSLNFHVSQLLGRKLDLVGAKSVITRQSMRVVQREKLKRRSMNFEEDLPGRQPLRPLASMTTD